MLVSSLNNNVLAVVEVGFCIEVLPGYLFISFLLLLDGYMSRSIRRILLLYRLV